MFSTYMFVLAVIAGASALLALVRRDYPIWIANLVIVAFAVAAGVIG